MYSIQHLKYYKDKYSIKLLYINFFFNLISIEYIIYANLLDYSSNECEYTIIKYES